MEKLKQQILFDKYECVKSLGSGSFGEVLLVRHISLNQLRAIKIVPHSQGETASEFIEAQLLNSIDYPGIPHIYDLEDYDNCFFIVEEYINGQSLDAFLLQQSTISIGLFFNFCEQLCNVFIYLHSLTPNPIIYRDLKPEHIIIQNQQLYLIDFGISAFAFDQGNSLNYYGNLDYSAPECFYTDDISFKADIYSLGKIIQFMSTYLDLTIPRNITHIIQKSTIDDLSQRYETVAELKSDLINEKEKFGDSYLCKKIAVLGTTRGCGATHVSIALTTQINALGYSALYIEKNDTQNLQNCAEYLPKIYEKNGILSFSLFKGIPKYGPGIEITAPEDATLIFDYGINYQNYLDESTDFDLLLLICGGDLWHIKESLKVYNYLLSRNQDPIIVVNLSNIYHAKRIARIFNTKLITFPIEENPFRPTSDKSRFLSQITARKGRKLVFLGRRKRFRIFHRP